MGKQWGMRVLGGMLSQLVLAGFLALGCDGGAAEANADAQAPAVGRPADAKGGPRVGVVVIASADVRVQPSQGAAFPAEQGVMLVRDDRLVTGADPGSFVVVELYNGHLVRFNQGTEIAVEKIAVFDAPRAGDDLAQRFEKVLRPEELGDERMRGAISRVAGWNSRMTAAETIAVLPAARLAEAPSQSPPPVSEMKAERLGEGVPGLGRGDEPQKDAPMDPLQSGGAGDLDDGAPGKNKPPRPDGDPRPTDVDTKKEAKKGDKESSSAPRTDPRPESPDSPDESSLDLPAMVTFVPDGGKASNVELPLALRAERRQLARCAGRGALLRAHVVKGLIAAIVVDNGNKCSLETSRGLSLADGWLEMRVK